MFCPNCGLQQADARNYCLRCGTDLTKKYERLEEIAATATPDVYLPNKVSADYVGRSGLPDKEDVELEQKAAAGPIQPVQLLYVGPQQFQSTQTPMQVPLANLWSRRLVCLPTFLGCLALGLFCLISNHEELAACIDQVREPVFGWGRFAVMFTIIVLGIVQALIGMGTIYSWQALATAFVMSAACAFVGLNYLPGSWKERLLTFGVFSVCALVEAVSAIGPIERKPKRPKKRHTTAVQSGAGRTSAGTKAGGKPIIRR